MERGDGMLWGRGQHAILQHSETGWSAVEFGRMLCSTVGQRCPAAVRDRYNAAIGIACSFVKGSIVHNRHHEQRAARRHVKKKVWMLCMSVMYKMCAVYRVLYCDVYLYISEKPPRGQKKLGETWATVINGYKHHRRDKRGNKMHARQEGPGLSSAGGHEGGTCEVPQEDRCSSMYIN